MHLARRTLFLVLLLGLTHTLFAPLATAKPKAWRPPGRLGNAVAQSATVRDGEVIYGERIAIGRLLSGTSACEIGRTGSLGDTVNFIYPPDEFYTRITASSCNECASTNTVRFKRVKLTVFFQVPCVYPVTVATVLAGGTLNCPVPRTSNLICPARAFFLAATESLSLMSYTLDLPVTCEFSGNAFLRIGMPVQGAQCAGDSLQPRIVVDTLSCATCTSYNDIDVDDAGTQDDMCTPFRIGNPYMGAVVDTCFDAIAPGSPTALAADSVSATAVRLAWTCPGDDNLIGRAASFQLRRATFPLNVANFTSGDPVTDVPPPDTSGTRQRFLVTGLDNLQTYYFALRAQDEEGNLSPLVTASATTQPAPGQVADLAPESVTSLSVMLRWTAPGGTTGVGLPEFYMVHGAEFPLTPGNFDVAPIAREIAATVATGEIQTYRFDGLEPARHYWFAVRCRDRQGNLSPVSNISEQWTEVGGPLSGWRGAGLASRYTPTGAPVELFWQAASVQVTSDQTIRIYDMNGRFVRTQNVGSGFGGVTFWDGRDYEGRPFPPGLYFARLLSAGEHADARIVLIR